MDPLLLSALELAQDLPATPANLKRVSAKTNEDAARWAFGQWALRKRAAERFPFADRMLFVREALEQATHGTLAKYHASLFPEGALVAELTCGIGGDLLALAERGPVLGFDLDSERASYARWNLEACGLTGEVRTEDGLPWLASPSSEYAFVDPARRVEGKRVAAPEQFSPNPTEFVHRATDLKRWVMKLTPFLGDDFLAEIAPRVEFVSVERECREALAIGGQEPVEPGVWAVQPGQPPLAGGGGDAIVTQTAEGFLYDVDPAAVRAHALGELGDQFGLRAVGDAPGYLVGPDAVDSIWMRRFRVLEQVQPKHLKAALRNHDSSTPILKQRGARQDLDRWHKDLRMEGARQLAVAFFIQGSSIRAAILDPA